MKIVNMKNFKINYKPGWAKEYKGFSIMNEAGEFLSLDGKEIYIPCGGRKALTALLPIADTFSFIPLH